MADEKDLEVDNKGGGKKKLIIIIIVAVVLLGGGAGAYFFMSSDSGPTEEEMAAALDSSSGAGQEGEMDGEGEASGASTGSALYIPMPRPFRFNVPGAARDRFVEIKVQLLVRGGDNEEEAKKHVPLIESTLLGVFSISNADDLATSAGKASLKQKSLVEVQKVMKDIVGKKVIEKVLFTGFVMQ